MRYRKPPAWQLDVTEMVEDYFAKHGKYLTAAPGWRKLGHGGAGHGLLYVEDGIGEAGEPTAHIVWVERDGLPRKPISYRRFKDLLEHENRRLRKAGRSNADRGPITELNIG